MDRNARLLCILREEIQPSFGCSGPIGAAVAACEAADAAGGRVQRIRALIDKDMCAKNSAVGIPPTGIRGIPAALAMGALFGIPGAGLQVLEHLTREEAAQAEAFAGSGAVEVLPDWKTKAIGVYIDVQVATDRGTGRAVVARSHSNVVYKAANSAVLLEKPFSREEVLDESQEPIRQFSIGDFVEFSREVPLLQLAFLDEAVRLNGALCAYGLSERSGGPGFGRSIRKRSGGIPLKKAKAMTSAAAEARMAGGALAAMSCATSGNAGIAVSLPLISLAEDYGLGRETLLRALACGYLVTISGKNQIGRHSAMCACSVCASLGVAAGTVLLFGGDSAQAEMAVHNTLVNVFGILCDGAREACALKLSTAAECGMEGALLALDGTEVPRNEGVCGASAGESLAFLGQFARSGMGQTDLALCRFLFHKHF